MNKGILSDALQQVGQVGKGIGPWLIKAGEDTTKTVSKQVIGEAGIEQKESALSSQSGQNVNALRKSQTREITKAMYEKSDSKTNNQNGTSSLREISEKIAQENPDKSPEEIQKMVQLRVQLHRESYFDPTFSSPKKEPEEKVEEKVEREKQEERWKLQEEEKKKLPPLAVSRERNKIESRVGSG